MNAKIRLQQAFTRIPLLEGYRPVDFKLSELRGYTNWNYRLQRERLDWVLRIPRDETNCYIDRVAEAHNQTLACKLGLAVDCLWRDTGGMSLTPTISAAREVRAADFEDAETTRRIVEALSRLHHSGQDFHGVIDLSALLARYYALLAPLQQQDFAARYQRALATLAELKQDDMPAVPSHNDPVLGNLLVQSDRLWLIDWEYSAMASPYWDLATICNAAALDDSRCANLLEIYCRGGEVMEESTLLRYRQLLGLLDDCWMAAIAARRTEPG